MKFPTNVIYIFVALIVGFALGTAWTSVGHEVLDGEYLRALKTMGGSGNYWIDAIFRHCVVLLVNVARFLGISYEALNIWIFVVIHPIITLALILWLIRLKKRV